MEFTCGNHFERPVRLSEETRKFAYDSLHHVYGLDTRKTPSVAMDHIVGFERMSPIEQYDHALKEIAEQAPIRICEGEKLSGAATLGMAIGCWLPATFQGKPLFMATSHLTVYFEKVLKIGVNGIRKEAEAALERFSGTEKEAFAQSCLATIDSLAIWHGRYLDALRDRPGYEENYANLQVVPFQPAETFAQAVQSIWFIFAFLRLLGNFPGIGRIDWLLGDYLRRDLDAGRVSMDGAREILAHFLIKGCEWICGGDYGSGDAQHYQNLVLGGTDAEGHDVCNEVSFLLLDVLEELGISDFPTTVRLNSRTDEKFLGRVAEVMRLGGGILAVYNEDKVLEAMKLYGYESDEAAHFANDGCWEVQVPGKTFFSYVPFDSLQILQRTTLRSYDGSVEFESFEALLAAYLRDLLAGVSGIAGMLRDGMFVTPHADGEPWVWKTVQPCTAVSLFEEGCLDKGLSYLEGGPVYNVMSPHIGGLADTVNSLLAIKKLVFDEKKVGFGEFMRILQDDWAENEALRQYCKEKYPYYGNDDDEADSLAARILTAFAGYCDEQNGVCGFRFPAGVSTFGRQLEWAPGRLASAHGRKAHEVLAANCSPTPGTDREGATAIIRSYGKLPLERMTTGAALDIRLLPSSVAGTDGLAALEALMRGFVALGGFFMQIDVVDADVLREAQKHPEDYQTLSVRVSGWNARFVTLNREWQDMVIQQNES